MPKPFRAVIRSKTWPFCELRSNGVAIRRRSSPENRLVSGRLIRYRARSMSRARLFVLAALSAALLTWFVFWRPAPKVLTLSGSAQGTTYNVSFWTEADADPEALQQAIDAEFALIDRSLSNYRPDSTIERWNESGSLEPVVVGKEIVELVEKARRVSEASSGCYDLTIAPVFKLWGFRGTSLTPPSDAALRAALADVGFHQVETRDGDRLVRKAPAIRIDLSSIGQGYSVGRIAALLEALGIENYLVEIGGEMQTRGKKPNDAPWRVGIERPVPGAQDPSSLQTVLTMKGTERLATMTSGTYRHYFDGAGRRYSHILDARSGKPIAHGTVSVTVLHEDPSLADAWSTALLCLGSEEGLAAADREGIATLFVDERDGAFTERPSRAWSELRDVQVE